LGEHERGVAGVNSCAGGSECADLGGRHDQVGIDPVGGVAFGVDGVPGVPVQQPPFVRVSEHRPGYGAGAADAARHHMASEVLRVVLSRSMPVDSAMCLAVDSPSWWKRRRRFAVERMFWHGVEAGQALRRMQGGRVVVLVSAVPYKCPAAPYEAALLAAALLRDRGLAERTSVEVYTPEPQPMPTAGPAMGEAVAGMLAARGIAPHTNTSVASVNASARELMLADARQTCSSACRRIGPLMWFGTAAWPPRRGPAGRCHYPFHLRPRRVRDR
jgi:hypothetical protein